MKIGNSDLIKKLYIVVFLTGAVVMILELIGSRILAPYLGTSISVWASLIGVILGAMSAGYYLGGRLADNNPNMRTLSFLIFFAGVSVFLILIFKSQILQISFKGGIELGSIFSSVALFALPAMLLGTISPYAARLSMNKIENSGKTIGSLYAVSTFGSIFGTFLAGFYLIPNFGSTKILYGLGVALFLIALFCLDFKKNKTAVFFSAIFLVSCSLVAEAKNENGYIVDEDSAYSHIQIYDTSTSDGQGMRVMALENFLDSGMYLDSDELVFEYSKFYRLDDIFAGDVNRAVMFGGAAYSVPKDFLLRNKTGIIDVVEIDPKTTELAKKYFRLEDNKRMNIFHEDARMFLNRVSSESGSYDAVYNDAFSSACSMPFHLSSAEAIEKVYNILDEDGVYIINLHSSLEGEDSIFFRSEYKTLKEFFDNIYVFGTYMSQLDSTKPRNIMIFASKKPADIDSIRKEYAGNPEISFLLDSYWGNEIYVDNVEVLTDDYAPVSNYVERFCNKG